MSAKSVVSVFRNYGAKMRGAIVNQSKPNVGTYAWQPNTSIAKRQGPQERGSFFVNRDASGKGSVGTGSGSGTSVGVTEGIGHKS